MSIKTKIKNDLWRCNYIIPFVKKYRFYEKGNIFVAKKIIKALHNIKTVKGHNLVRSVGDDTCALLSSIKVTIGEGYFIYFIDTTKTIAVPGNIISNFTIDYSKLLYVPFYKIVDAVQGDSTYAREIGSIAKGVQILQKNIINNIQKSSLPDNVKKARLGDFTNMLTFPVRHFEEGLQRILFYNQIMWQTRHRLNGLGRLDKWLGELYKQDVLANIITRDRALQLISDFLEKLSMYSEYKSDALEGDIGQIIVLGGKQEDGSYFFNELTQLFLEVQAKAKKPNTKIFLRVAENMPVKLLEMAVSCLEAKTGSPLFSNDEVVIPQLKDFGMPEKDGCNYCVSACWEPFIVGKSFDQNNIAVYDYEIPFNELLNNVMEIKSFQDLIDTYIKINQIKFIDFLTQLDKLKWAKDPFVSLLTDDCNERQVDISDGGAQYNNYGVTTVGLANVIDSFFNIKKFVFDSNKYTIQEFLSIRKRNFEGHENLVHMLSLNKYYGHDDPEVVKLVNKITDSLVDIIKKYRNKYGGKVKIGLSSPAYNIDSKNMCGDFSGRKQGSPYNTHISCLDAAYTELVNFAGQLHYSDHRFNGNVVDFFVSPKFIGENRDKFVSFLRAAIKQRFFQMQMNVLDSKTMIEAKNNPDKFPGLIVRVWGFSAYFNDLPESYKELLINRAIKAEQL